MRSGSRMIKVVVSLMLLGVVGGCGPDQGMVSGDEFDHTPESTMVTGEPTVVWDVDATSSDTPIAIPDNNSFGITSSITASTSGTVNALEVEVHITHTYIGDLSVSLVSPTGTTVVLHNRAGGSADNIDRIYTPANFNGAEVFGTWKLKVKDTASRDIGRLERWLLRAKVSTTVNHPPVANAGVDQAAASGALVTLDGSASTDPDGNVITFSWTQVLGPAVALSSASAVKPTFTAPTVTLATPLTFELVVWDGMASSPADAVTINVQPSSWLVDKTSTDTPKTIPDSNSTGISSTIRPTAAGNVTQSEVEVHITHTYIGDLVVKLTCPNGNLVTLHNRYGGSADNINTTYTITGCSGQPLAGNWKLTVTDLASLDIGTLDRWTLRAR
jgi:subtilisin-like proprotein convertase family protein